MASYEQQAEVLSKLNAFSDRNKTNFSKRDAVLHEINRHHANQASRIKFRKNFLESQKRANYVNEYDRLMGNLTSLNSGLVKDAPTINHISLRMGKLKELASESTHGKKHYIFKPKTDEQKTDKEVGSGSAEHAHRVLMMEQAKLESNLSELSRIRGRGR